MTKSPLRFPGGKSRAVKIITERFPAGITEMVSPFFGGGSIELWAAQNGIRVYGYDGFKPLVAFWEHLLKNPNHLADLAQAAFPMSKEKFYVWQDLLSEDDSAINASIFFILNRASFSGTTMSGGCSEPSEGEGARFTQSSINRLRQFADIDWSDKLSVNFSLWPDTLERHPDLFAYLDPPYIIKGKLYGVNGDMHDKFDHEALAKALRARDAPWLLSYNDCNAVLDLYAGFRIEEVSWSKSMSNGPSNELLIRNY